MMRRTSGGVETWHNLIDKSQPYEKFCESFWTFPLLAVTGKPKGLARWHCEYRSDAQTQYVIASPASVAVRYHAHGAMLQQWRSQHRANPKKMGMTSMCV